MAKTLMGSLETSVFCESLAMMLAAGVSSSEAMANLAEDSSSGAIHTLAKAVSEKLDAGSTLAPALEEVDMLPRYATKSIAIGESTGRTQGTLETLAAYYRGEHDREEHLRSSLAYPAGLLLIMVAVLAVMLFGVLPVFSGVYQNLAGGAASSSFWFLQAAQVVCTVALVITAIIAVVALVMVFRLAKSAQDSESMAGVVSKLPFAKRALYDISCAKMLQTLEVSIASGIPEDEAMHKALDIIDNDELKAKAQAVVKDIEDLNPLAESIRKENIFDPFHARMLIIGARSGAFEKALGDLADLCFEKGHRRLDTITDAAEPVLIGILVVVVGLSLISVMLPLVGIMGGVA